MEFLECQNLGAALIAAFTIGTESCRHLYHGKQRAETRSFVADMEVVVGHDLFRRPCPFRGHTTASTTGTYPASTHPRPFAQTFASLTDPCPCSKTNPTCSTRLALQPSSVRILSNNSRQSLKLDRFNTG